MHKTVCVCVFKGVYVKEQRWDKWSRPQGGGSDQSVFVQRTDALLFWWDQEATDCEHSVSPHAPTNTHSYLHTVMITFSFLCVFQANIGHMDTAKDMWKMIMGNLALIQVQETQWRLLSRSIFNHVYIH